ncbi:MAG: OadG family protein [Chloroflexi bacterium]|nr:OadG family protein [Chloroflexota bacterium]
MDDLMFGLQVTLYGMGLVFALLTLLWALLALVARLEARPQRTSAGAPVAAPAPQALAATGVRVQGPGADQLAPELLAAIAVAVLAHAADHRPQVAAEVRSPAPDSLLAASRWVSAGRARQTARATSRRRG